MYAEGPIKCKFSTVAGNLIKCFHLKKKVGSWYVELAPSFYIPYSLFRTSK